MSEPAPAGRRRTWAIGAALAAVCAVAASGGGDDLTRPWLAAPLPPPIAVRPPSDEPPPPERAATFEDQVMELVNQQRWSNGQLAPLSRCAPLDTSSETHSVNMGVRNFFAHCDPDTLTMPGQRMAAAGYNSGSWAENIAAGYSTPAAVVAGWMASSGHRANILSTTLRELGIGYSWDGSDTGNVRLDANGDCTPDGTGGPYYHYWTQNFGVRSTVYPVVIDREAYQTATVDVDLYLYGTGWASEMRIRNSGGVWTAWQPFAANVAWQLAPGPGVRQVDVEIRSGTTVRSASDSILSTAPVDVLFADGFESGGTGAWSSAHPRALETHRRGNSRSGAASHPGDRRPRGGRDDGEETTDAHETQPSGAELAATLLATALAAFAHADGLIIVHDPPMPGPRHAFAPLRVESHRVDVSDPRPGGHHHGRPVFYNPNAQRLEGTYLFPIPKGAQIDKFSMDVNGKMTDAELLDADEGARRSTRTSSGACATRRCSSTLGQGLFKVRIFPIEPREREAREAQVHRAPARRTGGLVELPLPAQHREVLGPAAEERLGQGRRRAAGGDPDDLLAQPRGRGEAPRPEPGGGRLRGEGGPARHRLPALLRARDRADVGVHVMTYREPGEAEAALPPPRSRRRARWPPRRS